MERQKELALMYYVYSSNNTKINMSSVQNSCAKYLYHHLDGSYQMKKYSTGAEVKSTVLYQIPSKVSKKYDLSDDIKNKVHEMDVVIDVTAYSNKLRVEISEISPDEKTIGFKMFSELKFKNLQDGMLRVLEFVKNSIVQEFRDYDILF